MNSHKGREGTKNRKALNHSILGIQQGSYSHGLPLPRTRRMVWEEERGKDASPPRMEEDNGQFRKRKRFEDILAAPRSRSRSSGSSSSSEDLEVAALNLLQGLVRLAQEQRKSRRRKRGQE